MTYHNSFSKKRESRRSICFEAGVPAVLLPCAGMHLPKIFGYPCNRNTGKKMQESLLQKYRFMIY